MMDMTRRAEKWCAWMVVPGAAFFFLAMAPLLGFLPPISPTLAADRIAQMYAQRGLSMQLGAIAMLFGGAFLMPFLAAISSALLRTGRNGPAWAYAQLASGILTFVPLYLSGLFFAAAAFRADRAPEDVQAINDIGWFFLVMPTPPFMLQLMAIGLAILSDHAEKPVFPRWVGYLNIWVGIGAIGGVMIPVFKTGPFAWDGLFAYWIPLGLFGPWMVIMLWAVLNVGPGSEANRKGE